VSLTEFGDERRALAFARLNAGVAARDPALLLKAAGKGFQTQHQVVNHRAVLLSEAGEHGIRSQLGES
jgi:hypothetical protein